MGNHTKGLFVSPETAAAIAEQLVPRADLITPNGFELGHLTGRPIDGVDAGRCTAIRDDAVPGIRRN